MNFLQFFNDRKELKGEGFVSLSHVLAELGFDGADGSSHYRYYQQGDPAPSYYISKDNPPVPVRVIKELQAWNNSYRETWESLYVSKAITLPAHRWLYAGRSIEQVITLGFVNNHEIYEVKLHIGHTNKGTSSFNTEWYNIENWSFGKPRLIKTLYMFDHFLTSDEEINEAIEEKSPYLYRWLNELNIPSSHRFYFIEAPYLETLYKAGYTFCQNFVDKLTNKTDRYYFYTQTDLDKINRLCQHGKSPKEIFKTPSCVYNVLKKETDLQIWDVYRKLMKFDRITEDSLRITYEQGYGSKDLEQINNILNKEYKGSRVFTWETLINYLGRVDQHEAIEKREALEILTDYLRMCQYLEMEPKIDGDSLKREHDIAARLSRLKRNEVHNQRIKERAECLKQFAYENKTYFIRPILSQDDLIDEATQQHNCVAGYSSRIAEGTSLIFVLREKDTPNRSLVTVELSTDCKTIRQKYMAFNKPIYNKDITEFLENWLDFVKKVSDINE